MPRMLLPNHESESSIMAHTPGPWINDGGLVNGRESRERYAPGVSIDIFNYSDWGVELRDEALANAALISAAPDLLKAANDALAGLRYIRRAHNALSGVNLDSIEIALVAAIIKAQGD